MEWTSPDRQWVGLETPNDEMDMNLFNAATKISIGDGRKACFWSSSWLSGSSPRDIAPKIFEVSKKKDRVVDDALLNDRWIADIGIRTFTVDHMDRFVSLWDMLQGFALSPGVNGTISWNLTANGAYSATSVYKAQFPGSTQCSFQRVVWKTCPPPPKCHFFAWLVVQNRLWTSDRLAIRGWPHQSNLEARRGLALLSLPSPRPGHRPSVCTSGMPSSTPPPPVRKDYNLRLSLSLGRSGRRGTLASSTTRS
ncbi:hypothetical protein QYE76_059867 [Lolium multiflorum]|uniref:Reverse transcriptase zinc-binding domain-containing protein n=1 Tax=Lolium multiflorum TaxID=4521 RepID=A0AAD8W5W9_LOLMU|nr:hypothetical protein QYE76_059867 [Lolium multiflorum]